MRFLQLMVLLVVFINLFSTVFILYRTEQAQQATTARVSNDGTVTFCFNQAPTLDAPCNASMSQDQPYSCQLNGTDPDDAGNLTYFVLPQAPENVSIFNISPTGLINFTPTNDNRGNHSVVLGVDDGSGCDNAYAYVPFNFTVANVNDPPYLISDIPDQTLAQGTTLFAFFLNDYFADPDDDPLTYSFLRGAGDIYVNLSIGADSSVLLSSSDCGKAHFRFRATDPGNLSALSNVVEVEVTCTEPVSGSGQGGGGGGGGGGIGALQNCTPEMVCLPWSECYPNGLQSQICKDRNGCTDKEVEFQQNCTYRAPPVPCDENWLCEEWGPCRPEGKQNRTCTDLAECGTTRYRPPLEQECRYQPRCDDGIQNGNETGIDCGGDCAPCKTIQQPSILSEAKGFASLLTLALIILLVVLLALFTLYRERIYEGLAELGWLLARRRRKEILLSPDEKRQLFEGLAELQARATKLAPRKAYEGLAVLARTCLAEIFDLPFEYTEEEFAGAAAKATLSDELRDVLLGVSAKLKALEAAPPAELQPVLFAWALEETRLLVCLASEYDVAEIERKLPERVVDEGLSFQEEIVLRILNAYEALQFLRTEAAETEYAAAMRAYENLDPGEKTRLYADIRRLYHAVLYVRETTA